VSFCTTSVFLGLRGRLSNTLPTRDTVGRIDFLASLAVQLDGVPRLSEKKHFRFCVRHGCIFFSPGFFAASIHVSVLPASPDRPLRASNAGIRTAGAFCDRRKGPAARTLFPLVCGLLVGFVRAGGMRVDSVHTSASLAGGLDGIDRLSENQHFWFRVSHGFVLLS